MQVIFHPEEQSKKIQDVYGDRGQYIKEDSRGFENREIDGDKVPGIIMYTPITENIKANNGSVSTLNAYDELIR